MARLMMCIPPCLEKKCTVFCVNYQDFTDLTTDLGFEQYLYQLDKTTTMRNA
jgi:hypothetical protein